VSFMIVLAVVKFLLNQLFTSGTGTYSLAPEPSEVLYDTVPGRQKPLLYNLF
jgi:hypothetical protein